MAEPGMKHRPPHAFRPSPTDPQPGPTGASDQPLRGTPPPVRPRCAPCGPPAASPLSLDEQGDIAMPMGGPVSASSTRRAARASLPRVSPHFLPVGPPRPPCNFPVAPLFPPCSALAAAPPVSSPPVPPLCPPCGPPAASSPGPSAGAGRRAARAFLARVSTQVPRLALLLLLVCGLALLLPLPNLGTRRAGAAHDQPPPAAATHQQPSAQGLGLEQSLNEDSSMKSSTGGGGDTTQGGGSTQGIQTAEGGAQGDLSGLSDHARVQASAVAGASQYDKSKLKDEGRTAGAATLAAGDSAGASAESAPGATAGEEDPGSFGGSIAAAFSRGKVASLEASATDDARTGDKGTVTGPTVPGATAGGSSDTSSASGSAAADASMGAAGSAADPGTPFGCRAPSPGGGHLVWDPVGAAAAAKSHSPKFLLLNCFRGQISKQVSCISNHILLAGLLNRTLLVPSSLPDHTHATRHFDLRLAFDLAHATRCLGKNRIIRTRDYTDQFGVDTVPIDLLYCWHGPRGACGEASRHKHGGRASAWEVTWACPAGLDLKREREQLLAGGGTLIVPLVVHRPFFTDPLAPALPKTPTRAACLPLQAPLPHLMSVYGGLKAKVLAVGDLGEHQVEDSDLQKRGGEQPFVRQPGCPNALVISPPQVLLRRAADIVRALFPDLGQGAGGGPGMGPGEGSTGSSGSGNSKGGNFLAVHWQGHGSHVVACRRSEHQGRCLYSMNQAAHCAVEDARRHGYSRIYVARMPKRSTTEEFKAALHMYAEGSLEISELPEDVLGDAEPLLEEEIPGVDLAAQMPLLKSIVDKLVCAHASMFLGTPASPFSLDVLRLRRGLGLASCNDEILCHGEAEWEPGRTGP